MNHRAQACAEVKISPIELRGRIEWLRVAVQPNSGRVEGVLGWERVPLAAY